MNREQAKELLPIIQAFAEGRPIEFKDSYGKWVVSETLTFNWPLKNYRIKSESKCRPFKDAEECWQEMLKHKPFGWVRYREAFISFITQVSLNCISIGKNYYFKEANEEFTFADGTPFGIKED